MSVLDSYRQKVKFRVGDRGKTTEGDPYRVICVDRLGEATGRPIITLISWGVNAFEVVEEFTADGYGCGVKLLPPTERGRLPSDAMGYGSLLALRRDEHGNITGASFVP